MFSRKTYFEFQIVTLLMNFQNSTPQQIKGDTFIKILNVCSCGVKLGESQT